jgi:hypothetical protein
MRLCCSPRQGVSLRLHRAAGKDRQALPPLPPSLPPTLAPPSPPSLRQARPSVRLTPSLSLPPLSPSVPPFVSFAGESPFSSPVVLGLTCRGAPGRAACTLRPGRPHWHSGRWRAPPKTMMIIIAKAETYKLKAELTTMKEDLAQMKKTLNG